jgi:hypothetical protein
LSSVLLAHGSDDLTEGVRIRQIPRVRSILILDGHRSSVRVDARPRDDAGENTTRALDGGGHRGHEGILMPPRNLHGFPWPYGPRVSGRPLDSAGSTSGGGPGAAALSRRSALRGSAGVVR